MNPGWSVNSCAKELSSGEDLRDGYSGLFFVLVQKVGYLLHGFIMARVSTPENDEHADCVLVDVLHDLLGVDSILALLADRHQAASDIEIAGEFLKSNLGVRTHNDVWTRLMDRKTLFLASLLPQTFHGETSKLDSLGGTCRCGPYRPMSGRCMPQVRNHRNTTSMNDLWGGRIRTRDGVEHSRRTYAS